MREPKQARSIETRDRLLRGAAEVFALKGYEGASTADILAASGVTRGSMYFHFGSKEGVGRALLVLQTQMVRDFALTAHGRAAQKIIDASYAFGSGLQDDMLLRASVRMTTEGHGFDGDQRSTFDEWLTLVTDLASRAVKEGDIADWEPALVGKTLTASVNGIQQSSLIYSDYSDILERLDAMWRMLSPGLFTTQGLSTLRLEPPTAQHRRG